jgi:hypothetical protein
MVTYLYWALVIGLVVAVIVAIGIKMDNLKGALVAAAVLLFIGWALYYFYLQQIFVKRWGGVMTIKVPDGQYHIATTWKEDNLWVENYDPETNRCVFSEYSKGNLLQGRVTIKNCNPISLRSGTHPAPPPNTGVAPPLPGGPQQEASPQGTSD